MVRAHGTCIEIDGTGILLLGDPGAGKSDLALRLMEGGARLVADDQTELRALEDGAVLQARAPEAIAGLFEVRGLGVVPWDALEETLVRVVVELVAPGVVERMPEPESWEVEGVVLPLWRLAPFEASAPAKVRLAARMATGAIIASP